VISVFMLRQEPAWLHPSGPLRISLLIGS